MIKPQSLTRFVRPRLLPSHLFTGVDQPGDMLSFQCIVMQWMEVTGMRQELSGSAHQVGLTPDDLVSGTSHCFIGVSKPQEKSTNRALIQIR